MKKTTKVRICNWTLALLLPLVLASGIQLEVTSCDGQWPTIIHLIVTIAFISVILWHIYLHFKWGKWLYKFSKIKVPTRILWWLYLLTTITGFAALIHWIATNTHTALGGIHGKIGFLMLAFAIGHTLKRVRFFYPRSKSVR